MNRRVLGLVLWVGCKQGTDAVVLSDPSGCDPLVPEICSLPWPSSHFEADAPTVTGKRLAFAENTLPMNRDAVQVRPDMLGNKDGFSTLGPVALFFEDVSIAGVVGHEDLGAYLAEDARTVIVDTVTHERVPHFVERDATAEDEALALLFLRPVVPLEHGRRYVVGVRALERRSGGAVASSDAFVALRDGTATQDSDIESRRNTFEALVFPELAGQGFKRGELQLAWDFGTVSRESSLGPALAVRDDALTRTAADIPFTISSVEESDCAEEGTTIARTVYGKFTSPRYTDIDGPGARLARDANGVPAYTGDTQVGFMVRIPCSLAADPGSGGQVLQYGHGLLGDYGEARTGYLSELANENRWVVFAQNWTGMSTLDAGYVALMLALDVSDFDAIPDRTVQGFSEWVVGLKLATGALATDDALKFGGASVIDTTKKPLYYGNSQGAILGGAYVALSPDIERAVFGVGGMPYSLLLSRSADFDPFFLVFKEKFTDPRDIALLQLAFQTAWDPGESSGYAYALTRDPLPNTPNKRVLMQVAIGDAQVTTLGAHIAARAYGATSVGPAVRPIWGVPESTGPIDGSAIAEWLYEDGPVVPVENLPPSKDADTHECPRREPAAQAQMIRFFETGIVEQFCDGPCRSVRAGLCD